MRRRDETQERPPKGALQKELGRRIVRRREQRGWTQAELARRLGVQRERLGKWERGTNAPSLEDQAALSEVLEVSLEELGIGRQAEAPFSPAELRELACLLDAVTRRLKPWMERERLAMQRFSGVMKAPDVANPRRFR